MTLTIIFDKDAKHVLMCFHSKQGAYNYIGGHIRECEQPLFASYREVEEETGITREDIELHFVREEHVAAGSKYYKNNRWRLHVTAGILNKDVVLKEEKNSLEWIDTDDYELIIGSTFGYGNCYTYLLEAMDVLGLRKES